MTSAIWLTRGVKGVAGQVEPGVASQVRVTMPRGDDCPTVPGLGPARMVTPGATSVSRRPMTLAGRYSVGTVLGFGGMGEVYSGRDRFLNRPVALKILRAELARDPAVLRWFEQEARMAARLAHPHVVSVFDVGEDRGVPFLVMEVLSGRTFGDEMDSGPMAVEAVRRVAYHILGALDAAHRAGVVHGDVKPSNILEADPSSTVWKLADFGVATDLFTVEAGAAAPRLGTGFTSGPSGAREVVGEMGRSGSDLTLAEQVAGQSSDLTLAGSMAGTVAYLSPERLAGESPTPSSDIYAFGVVLYEALSGHRNLRGTKSASLAGNRPSLQSLRSDLPGDLVAVVEVATDPDPRRRFASAAAMAAVLAGATRDAEPTAVVAAVLGSAAGLEAASSREDLVHPTRRTSRRHRVRYGAIAASAVLSVLAAALLVLARGHFDTVKPVHELVGTSISSTKGSGRHNPSTESTPPPTTSSGLSSASTVTAVPAATVSPKPYSSPVSVDSIVPVASTPSVKSTTGDTPGTSTAAATSGSTGSTGSTETSGTPSTATTPTSSGTSTAPTTSDS